MKAVLVAHVTIKDNEQFTKYVEASAPSLAAFGAKFAFRGKVASIFAGEHNHNIVGIIEFPDKEAMIAWYNSPDYQQVIPLRARAADVTFIGYESA